MRDTKGIYLLCCLWVSIDLVEDAAFCAYQCLTYSFVFLFLFFVFYFLFFCFLFFCSPQRFLRKAVCLCVLCMCYWCYLCVSLFASFTYSVFCFFCCFFFFRSFACEKKADVTLDMKLITQAQRMRLDLCLNYLFLLVFFLYFSSFILFICYILQNMYDISYRPTSPTQSPLPRHLLQVKIVVFSISYRTNDTRVATGPQCRRTLCLQSCHVA